MKAALLSAYHQPLELVDRPAPELTRPDHVRVRVTGAGVCATDLHAIDGLMEPAGVTLPLILGHENAGVVEEVGELVTTVAAGDPVIVYPPYTCGVCPPCRRGEDLHCVRHQMTGLTVDGGFAESLVVVERCIVPLPAGLRPVDVAPHADAGLTAYHAVRRVAAHARPGATTVVIGIGGVGHIAVQLVRELANSATIAIDPDPPRRALALELGADHAVEPGASALDAVRELTGGRGADVVLDFVGTDDTHRDSLAMLARHGVYSVIGYGGAIPATSMDLVVSEHTIVGNLVGTWSDLHELIALHAAGRVTVRVQTHPLSEINTVLAALRAGEIIGRAVLVP